MKCSPDSLIDLILAPTYYYFTHFPWLPWQSAVGKGKELLTVVLDTTVFFPLLNNERSRTCGSTGLFLGLTPARMCGLRLVWTQVCVHVHVSVSMCVSFNAASLWKQLKALYTWRPDSEATTCCGSRPNCPQGSACFNSAIF